MPPRHILLLGGHGAIALLLTPLLISRSYHITSLIRHPTQKPAILALQKNHPGKLDVLVRSLEDVKSEEQARAVVEEVGAGWVVWCAGAGGKGGAERTFAVDRDACVHFIRACASTPSVTKFLLISYLGSRRSKAPWWSDADWAATQEVNAGVLKNYYAAKLVADECLVAAAKERGEDFQAICLRPGSLTDEPAGGKIGLGKTRARGKVRRGDVAEVVVGCLESERVRGWVDLLEGEEAVREALERVGREQVNCVEGEDVEAMFERYKKAGVE